MKSIGNIYLAWHKDAHSQRILVGIIKQNANEGVRFTYLADGVLEAIPLGFKPYVGFPDPIDVYKTNVLRIFGLRILKAAADFKNSEAYFEVWDINREYKSKPYYMLAYTHGMLPSDNFEFLASFNPDKDFSLVTELCDLNPKAIEEGALSEGDLIRYQTQKNSGEVRLYKGELYLGQVKTVHSRIFKKAKNFTVSIHRIDHSNVQDKVFIKIARS